MKSIELKNVTFSYPNGYTAVENINISVEKGETLAIIGQNGAGKTTTVKMMNGLLRPTQGEVYINGENIQNQSCATVSRKVGYVFQNPGDQIFNGTVFKEIAYALQHQDKKLNQQTIRERVLNAAKLCHIEEFLEQNPYDLPFSLRKFVTIALCIANDCEIFILDEPTAGQDSEALLWLKEIIDYLHQQGKTILTITHDMDFVIENFNRVLVMAQKKVLATGNLHKLFWDHNLLKEAALKQPTVSELAYRLALKDPVVTVSEFAQSYTQHYWKPEIEQILQ